MLDNIRYKLLLRVLIAGLCSTIFTAAALAMESSSEFGTCLYSAQLASDPTLRAEFTAQISPDALNEPQTTDYSDIYESDIEANVKDSGRTGNRMAIDQFSNNCLSCHDGVIAKHFNVRVKNDPRNRVMSLEDIVGGHPIGMQYKTYATADSNKFNDDVSFSEEMIFAEGKVGCLTCHNPLNRGKGHLTINNEGSKLCFACHRV